MKSIRLRPTCDLFAGKEKAGAPARSTTLPAAPAARHALYFLDMLAVLVLNDVAEIDPAVVATVGRLVGGVGERVAGACCSVGGVRGCARINLVHSHSSSLWAGSRVLVAPRGRFYVYQYCLITVLQTQAYGPIMRKTTDAGGWKPC